MSDRIERLLELLSPDGQSSPERAYPAQLDLGPGACARCQRVPVESAEFCDGCRAFLLEDSDIDPLAPAPIDLDELAAAWQSITDALSAWARQVTEAFEALGAAIASYGTSLQELVDEFEKIAAPEPPARARELELLAERRREHRHPTRWGPPPGRAPRSRR